MVGELFSGHDEDIVLTEVGRTLYMEFEGQNSQG